MNFSSAIFQNQESPKTALIRFLGFVFGLVVLVLSGCATTAPRMVYEQPLPEDFNVQDYNYLDVVVDSTANVTMASYEKERLASKIIEKVKELETVRFEGFNVPGSGQDTLSLEVTVTRYDKGNAFARMMLMGLGQIHVDGDVVLREKDSQRLLEKANVKKTFAWGGMYGASTRIEDVEDGFAAGVIDALRESRDKTKATRKAYHQPGLS
jgi:hypothetical protein